MSSLEIEIRDVVGHLSEGLQVIGADFTYLYVNPVAAEHGRSTPEALIGKTMMEAYPGIEETEMFAHLQRVLQDGGTHRMENEFEFPNGSKGWFELRIARIPAGAVILSIDVTERKRLESRMHSAQRMDAIGQLAGGFAHDFNNLLTIVLVYGAFVRDGLDESHPLREDAEQVLQAARRGSELTQKMLTLARQMPVSPEAVDVSRALDEVGKLLGRVLGEDIVLTLTVEPELGSVLIDPSSFDQVLLNLAINARDAMPHGGSLSIEAGHVSLDETWSVSRGVTVEPGRYVVISVTDSGVGIPPEILNRVFEPFFTTKEDGAGTGLGLATSWGLIRQAGGTIGVYSEEGVGTTFRVYLPLIEEQSTASKIPRAREAPAPRPARQRILLAEDQEEVRTLISRILRERGYRVLEAKSGAEALLLLEDVGSQIDLLITDVVMPRMSGLELADRVRPRFPGMAVLLVSGYAPASLGPRGASSADLPLLSKPFSPERLLAAVREALSA